MSTFTFTASAPLAVIVLRGLSNEAGEWLGTTLPPSGQTAGPLDEISDLPEDFTSRMLRGRINDRGELKATTIVPFNELAPAASQDRFFAYLADSGGWSTELILFSGTVGETSTGSLDLFWFSSP